MSIHRSVHAVRSRRGVALAAAAASLLGVVAAAPASRAVTTRGFHVSGTQLLDANNKPFVMRGVNQLNAAHPETTAQAIQDISALGANSVRLTVTAGSGTPTTAKDISTDIDLCKKVKVVCVFTDQDTQGYGEASQTTAISLSQAADFWISVKGAFAGQEAYTLIDIGNLPFGSTAAKDWTASATAAVIKLRAGGLGQTLLIGGPDYGEDTSGVMRTNAPKVFAADPKRNVVFAVAMYATYSSLSPVKQYIDAFNNKNLALTISEFSWAYLPWGALAGTPKGPDEASIMAYAQKMGTGWFAYSWSNSSAEKAYDDMTVDSNAAVMTPWGSEVATGANGLSETSKRASVYG